MEDRGSEGIGNENSTTIPSFSPSNGVAEHPITLPELGPAAVSESDQNQQYGNAFPAPPSPARSDSPDSDSWQCSGASALLQVEALMSAGVPLPRILNAVCPEVQQPPEGWSDHTIMGILAELLDQPPRREKLSQYNTLEDAIELFRTRRRILILTGAGVSVSCGIPDFRSKNGIYARLHVDFPDLPDPTAMFDIRYFRGNPVPFYNFAKEIFPGQFEPSVSHKFIRQLENSNQLLRNYTQNIDTLEKQTGIQRVIECHGSFSKATCLSCKSQFDGDIVKEDVMAQRVARCPNCKEGVIKPDIVFFGEDLGRGFHRQMAEDKDQVDLLVVIGSSLKVRPVSLIPFSVAPDVPQILINRESLPAYTADIELLGDCDDIIREICLALGGYFTEMVVDHDRRIAEKKHDENVNSKLQRRELLSEDWFRDRMNTLEQEQLQPSETSEEGTPATEDVEEPDAKRARLSAMYQRRYISVEQELPENSYFQLVPNRAIFPGAELHFDLEYKSFIRLTPVHAHGSNSESSDSEDDDDSTASGGSEPANFPHCLPSYKQHEALKPEIRSTSCEPRIDTDKFSSTPNIAPTELEPDHIDAGCP